MQMQNQAVSLLLMVCQLVIHFVTMSKRKKIKLILQTSPPLVRYLTFGKFIVAISIFAYKTTIKCQVVFVYLAVL